MRPTCPTCGAAAQRVQRLADDRQALALPGRRQVRFACRDAACGWHGLLSRPLRRARTSARLRRRWRSVRAVLHELRPQAALGLMALSVVVAVAAQGEPEPPQARSFAPGEVYDGVPLADDHPLQERADAAPAGPGLDRLALRSHCRWGKPGRNPYRGTVEQALMAAGLPDDAVRAVALQVRAGKPAERLVIGNDGIRGEDSGRVFDARKLALSYGTTMCIDSTVNFPAGHTEPASLYEVSDTQGRSHAVMVPDACGNVSVLSAAADGEEAGAEVASAAGRAARRSVGGDKGSGGVGVLGGGGMGSREVRAVPSPSTALCVGLGLVLLAWVRTRR